MLKNSTILITGASSGIGRACAVLLSEYADHLILLARSADKLEQLKKELKNEKTHVVHFLFSFSYRLQRFANHYC